MKFLNRLKALKHVENLKVYPSIVFFNNAIQYCNPSIAKDRMIMKEIAEGIVNADARFTELAFEKLVAVGFFLESDKERWVM